MGEPVAGMKDDERERFDALVDEAIDQLPDEIHGLLEEVPVVVLDRPTPEMLRDLGMDPNDQQAASELCGLHSGRAITETSVNDAPELPSEIHLFREGILLLAGGWDQPDADDAVFEEIWVTLLHEIGHQFGLDEDDLRDLGYD
ncbi:MAG: metallopeptidase family protein [Planctomycetota bacterium]|nr:metallopeptidase family protein [Planctomycetota bacterium]